MLSIEQRKFLSPLITWRILDIENLIQLSKQNRSYSSAQKLLKRLQQRQLIEIYRDPWNKKNYVFLGNLAIKELCPDTRPLLNSGALYHDSKVTSLGVELLKFNKTFKSIELEHQIKKGKGVIGISDFIPDARVEGQFKAKFFQAAVELELHQKEKSRIVDKAKYYLESEYYNHALYFFPDNDLLQNYDTIIKKELGSDYNKKIFLFSCPLISKAKPSFENGTGLVMNKSKTFIEFFGGVH